MQHIDFSIVKAVLVASPGFFKDGFLKYMHEQAQRQGLRVLLDNKGKFVPCHASSGETRFLCALPRGCAHERRCAHCETRGSLCKHRETYGGIYMTSGYKSFKFLCYRGDVCVLCHAISSYLPVFEGRTRLKFCDLAGA